LGSNIGLETWGSIFLFHLLVFISTHSPPPSAPLPPLLHFHHHSQTRISTDFLLSVLSPFAYSANLHHQLPPLAASLHTSFSQCSHHLPTQPIYTTNYHHLQQAIINWNTFTATKLHIWKQEHFFSDFSFEFYLVCWTLLESL
jgi:hypothetical protein